jgi:hypothetical protein
VKVAERRDRLRRFDFSPVPAQPALALTTSEPMSANFSTFKGESHANQKILERQPFASFDRANEGG